MKNNIYKKNEPAKIEVRNISKTFHINALDRDLALSHLTNIKNFFKSCKHKKNFLVLDDISFDVNEGEVLGIIGRNGAGKSTLLRVIAEIYKPDCGKILHCGEVFYLTTMGVGLMNRLTMKDNVSLVGSIMGLGQKRIKEIYNDIVEFSELGNFVEMKVRQFSTGMIGRLGFSISIFCMKNKNSEILLLDEVFGSGADFEFEKKAITKMEELINGGATVLMVSHDLDMMEKNCDRIIWLESGKIKDIGDAKDIIAKYKNN